MIEVRKKAKLTLIIYARTLRAWHFQIQNHIIIGYISSRQRLILALCTSIPRLFILVFIIKGMCEKSSVLFDMLSHLEIHKKYID